MPAMELPTQSDNKQCLVCYNQLIYKLNNSISAARGPIVLQKMQNTFRNSGQILPDSQTDWPVICGQIILPIRQDSIDEANNKMAELREIRYKAKQAMSYSYESLYKEYLKTLRDVKIAQSVLRNTNNTLDSVQLAWEYGKIRDPAYLSICNLVKEAEAKLIAAYRLRDIAKQLMDPQKTIDQCNLELNKMEKIIAGINNIIPDI
jgi:hypothetical protein